VDLSGFTSQVDAFLGGRARRGTGRERADASDQAALVRRCSSRGGDTSIRVELTELGRLAEFTRTLSLDQAVLAGLFSGAEQLSRELDASVEELRALLEAAGTPIRPISCLFAPPSGL